MPEGDEVVVREGGVKEGEVVVREGEAGHLVVGVWVEWASVSVVLFCVCQLGSVGGGRGVGGPGGSPWGRFL